MKLENKEPNYAASVVKIHNLIDLENSDNIVGFPCQGFQAIVSKHDDRYSIGSIGILFPTECQLSHDFCHHNNLYRKSELNSNTEAKGYIEEKRRVKAVKLRGNKSTALFMPLDCLSYLGIKPQDLKEGDNFTHINGVEVCRKYELQIPKSRSNKTRGQTKKFVRVDNKTFPEHWDTENFWRNEELYKDTDYIIVTQKLHGTSARFTNARVLRKLSLLEKLVKKLGFNINEYEYDTLAGSRRVIKDIKAEKNHDHFYDIDLWNFHLEKIQHLIPKNWVIYGEIVGWVNEDKPIQKGYTYCLPRGTSEFYVYRISTVNQDGIVVDLSWSQIKEWCKLNGIKHVVEMWAGYFSQFHVDNFMDIEYNVMGWQQCLPVNTGKDKRVDEGICIRLENRLNPWVTKAKCPEFLLHETNLLDKGEVDIESQEGINELETTAENPVLG